MKKVFMILLPVIFLLPTGVCAQEIPYYTNSYGVNLTQEQYNKLLSVFSEESIYTMTPETLEIVKNAEYFTKTESEKYIRVDSYYDVYGNIVKQTETEITKSEALDNNDGKITPYSWNITHQTNMKKLYMQVISPAYMSHKVVTLTNTWLSIPVTKSFDVIAVRPETHSLVVTILPATISGYQKWDGNIINYNVNNNNTKRSASFTGNGGVGISMNIVDDVKSTLENSLTVTFVSEADPFKIWGTYQHAQSDVTLAQSQNYSFGSSGLGNVLNFNSSIKSKYDGMQGVYLDYYFGEHLG